MNPKAFPLARCCEKESDGECESYILVLTIPHSPEYGLKQTRAAENACYQVCGPAQLFRWCIMCQSKFNFGGLASCIPLALFPCSPPPAIFRRRCCRNIIGSQGCSEHCLRPMEYVDAKTRPHCFFAKSRETRKIF